MPTGIWSTARLELIDRLATVRRYSGSRVDLLGHSYGGNIAFGATTLTTNIRKLVLYEGWPVPDVAHRTIAPEVMGVCVRSRS
jgi:pimeloyl-ACP methyl ester carboxylesterase